MGEKKLWSSLLFKVRTPVIKVKSKTKWPVKIEANIASHKNISLMSKETPERGPSSKLYLFKSLLTGTLHRKVNAHSVHKWGSCPSWIKFIEQWFADFFFSSHFNIPDGCDTRISNCGSLQHWFRMWGGLPRENISESRAG